MSTLIVFTLVVSRPSLLRIAIKYHYSKARGYRSTASHKTAKKKNQTATAGLAKSIYLRNSMPLHHLPRQSHRVPSLFPTQSARAHGHPQEAYYLSCLYHLPVPAYHYLVIRVSAEAEAAGFHFCTQELGDGRADSGPGAQAQAACRLFALPLPSPSRASIPVLYLGDSRTTAAEQTQRKLERGRPTRVRVHTRRRRRHSRHRYWHPGR